MASNPVMHAYTPYPSPQSSPSASHHMPSSHPAAPGNTMPHAETVSDSSPAAENPTPPTKPLAHQAFLALPKRKHFSFILHNLRFIFFGNPSIITTAKINLTPIPHLLVVHGIAHDSVDGVYEGVAVRFDHSNTAAAIHFVDAHARPPEPWPLLTRHSRLQPGDDRVMVTVPYNANVVAVAVAEASRAQTDARSARALACLRKSYMNGGTVRVCVCGVGVKEELGRLIEGMEARRGVGRAE